MLCNINVTLKSSLKALQSITDQVSLASALPSVYAGVWLQLPAVSTWQGLTFADDGCAMWCSCQECLGSGSGLSHLRNAQCCSLLNERMTLTAQKCLWDCQGPEDTPSFPWPCQELKGQIMKPMKQIQHWSLGERGKKVPLPIFLTIATG